MTWSYRWKLKRRLNHALKHFEQGENWIVQVGYNYKDKYPNTYEEYCKLLALTELLKQYIVKLRDNI